MDESVEEIVTNLPRWSVTKRLEFIEFRLFWYGRFNRIDLTQTFSISPQQASADIAQYESLAPSNLQYDRAQKAYLRGSDFEPKLMSSSSDRFLLQVVAITNGWMDKADSWFDQLPPMEIVSLRRPPIDAKHLLRVLDAIRNREEIDIEYHSMTGSASDQMRSIAPHSLAYCAGRFYLRAWSREHNDFRDYHLNRINRVGTSRTSPADPSLDFEWQHTIDLVIAPNPELPEKNRAAVQLEYQMIEGILRVPCRLSLSFYLMSEHNLDVEPKTLTPFKQQLVLLNREEVEKAREVSRSLSRQALQRATLKS